MSLSSSLYTGVSGLQGHGEKMGVIGNNIANISTVGFKGSRMHFEDFMSKYVNDSSGVSQVGMGVSVGTVMGQFHQGSVDRTNTSTDVSISGNGFFVVSPGDSEEEFFTRAGNFRFNNDGQLVEPGGRIVQGYRMEDGEFVTPGRHEDIELDTYISPPRGTSNVQKIFNLDSTLGSATGSGNDIFTAWDAVVDPDNPIDPGDYIFQSTTKVYDENGGSHNLTTYFDRMHPDDEDPWLLAEGFPVGHRVYEFIVTVPPDSDQRDQTVWGFTPQQQGIVMEGRIVFDAAGEVVAMRDLDNYYPGPGATIPDYEDLDNPDGYRNGLPLMGLSFSGAEIEDPPGSGVFFPAVQLVELDLGLTNPTGDQADPWEKANFAPTSYSSKNEIFEQNQDGYTQGFLQNITFNSEGVMTGRYSNGQAIDLYALTLADFNNQHGLNREGSNLFAATRASGNPIHGTAGSARLGTVSGSTLEMSNVDLATEFVKMITTEKGFQANSKVVTTTDQMLSMLIQMKR